MRKGQGLTEFALLFPIVMIAFLGFVELGLWVQSWISVATAAREGARFGSRGLHVTASEIAEVSEVSLSSTLDLVFELPNPNVKIIVTQIDVEPDGSFVVYEIFSKGELVADSAVCTVAPCAPDTIDITSLSDANLAFNDNPAYCLRAEGCRADIVVVETFYKHHLLFPIPLMTDFLNNDIMINGHGIMRVLFRREEP
ncbi:MAG: TadE/TadG family type IV pilus assembly protein [Anaerolineales bacterium]|jgi:hypothetical protein